MPLELGAKTRWLRRCLCVQYSMEVGRDQLLVSSPAAGRVLAIEFPADKRNSQQAYHWEFARKRREPAGSQSGAAGEFPVGSANSQQIPGFLGNLFFLAPGRLAGGYSHRRADALGVVRQFRPAGRLRFTGG